MARTGGYIVLAHYNSSSSDSIYQVRRGGDSVLYCTCRGWVASKEYPKRCRHCKDYVHTHPGTLYLPPNMAQAMPASPDKTLPQGKRKVAVQPTLNASLPPAGTNWRAMLLAEVKATRSRGVETPKEALEEYASALDLGPLASRTIDLD